MNQSPEKFIEQFRSLRLSGAEREALRAEIIVKMRSGGATRSVRSPWSEFFAMRRFQAAFLIAIIIISYGSSAALAAEGALPGDILYPVKTKVVEPLARLVVARTPEREAEFETKLLERRLHEAEALDDKETLEAPLREEVRERVRAQSARTGVAARRADEESDDESSALPSSDVRSASSTIATSAPTRLEDDRRSEGDSDKREREEKRAERAARVLKEHARILERLELSDESDDDEESGDDNVRQEREEKDDD